jgi:hypothetical protein
MQPAHKNRTHLFTLHLWEERVDREESELRFKVRHVLSGEVRYFRDWADVFAFVISTVEKNAGDALNAPDRH